MCKYFWLFAITPNGRRVCDRPASPNILAFGVNGGMSHTRSWPMSRAEASGIGQLRGTRRPFAKMRSSAQRNFASERSERFWQTTDKRTCGVFGLNTV